MKRSYSLESIILPGVYDTLLNGKKLIRVIAQSHSPHHLLTTIYHTVMTVELN